MLVIMFVIVILIFLYYKYTNKGRISFSLLFTLMNSVKAWKAFKNPIGVISLHQDLLPENNVRTLG